jgi:hypothetical protein
LDCRIGKPIEHVINYTDESQLPPALSTGVGLVITGEENVGEEYFERVLGQEVAVEEVETPELESPVAIDVATSNFADYMNSIGVATTEEETVEEDNSQATQRENEPETTNEVKEDSSKQVNTNRGGRRSFGESMLGRFKGFFENDEAVN